MIYENILYDKKEGIATITFNRPKVLNALNRKTVEELQSALLDARDDERLCVHGLRIEIGGRAGPLGPPRCSRGR